MMAGGYKTGLMVLVLVGLFLGGCGYSLSPTPYGLAEPLAVRVPVVTNQSRYGDLGPLLTTNLVNRLDASPDIYVRESAQAQLTVSIKSVAISGGAWRNTRDDDDLPTDSASRVVYMVVEAVLERPDPMGGQPLVRRHVFNGQRNFLVNNDQAQVDLRQREAFEWLVGDLSQKIAQTMFSDF